VLTVMHPMPPRLSMLPKDSLINYQNSETALEKAVFLRLIW